MHIAHTPKKKNRIRVTSVSGCIYEILPQDEEILLPTRFLDTSKILGALKSKLSDQQVNTFGMGRR